MALAVFRLAIAYIGLEGATVFVQLRILRDLKFRRYFFRYATYRKNGIVFMYNGIVFIQWYCMNTIPLNEYNGIVFIHTIPDNTSLVLCE